MKTSKYFYWTTQFGGWIAYGILISLATYADKPQNLNLNFLISLCSFLSLGIILTHCMRYFFLRFNFLNLKLTQLIPRIIFFSAVTALAMATFNHFISYYIEKDYNRALTSLPFLIEILSLSLLIILWNAIYFTYHFFRKTLTQDLHVLQMQASQNEIELKSLRAQINPHFLFNSLNSIRALIDIEPKMARQAVTTLSNLLRKSLVQGKNAFITVEEEIDLVRNYLELEKIRFEERLTINWEIDSNVLLKEIPPFLIHAQVENAIKHGVSKLINGGMISVKVSKMVGEGIFIEIINSGKIIDSKSETKIGIANTKRRLLLQYKEKASFDLFQNGEFVHCKILIE